MRSIRIDDKGALRCWYCGGRDFNTKRVVCWKDLLAGVLLLKVLHCDQCDENNLLGEPVADRGPAGREFKERANELDTPQANGSLVDAESLAADLVQLDQMLSEGMISQLEYEVAHGRLFGRPIQHWPRREVVPFGTSTPDPG